MGNDEVTCAMRLCDGVLLCVDAIEGVMINTKMVIKQACLDGLPMCLLITKIDRLITQLKIPPVDAYYKIRHTIDDINRLIGDFSLDRARDAMVEPNKGNVCFSAA